MKDTLVHNLFVLKIYARPVGRAFFYLDKDITEIKRYIK